MCKDSKDVRMIVVNEIPIPPLLTKKLESEHKCR